jgi:cytochrome d ubiquinol oxidase subunit II
MMSLRLAPDVLVQAPQSLKIILAGVVIVPPSIAGDTIFSYRVFWGKTRELSYS